MLVALDDEARETGRQRRPRRAHRAALGTSK
jgi:hypothetical protein